MRDIIAFRRFIIFSSNHFAYKNLT